MLLNSDQWSPVEFLPGQIIQNAEDKWAVLLCCTEVEIEAWNQVCKGGERIWKSHAGNAMWLPNTDLSVSLNSYKDVYFIPQKLIFTPFGATKLKKKMRLGIAKVSLSQEMWGVSMICYLTKWGRSWRGVSWGSVSLEVEATKGSYSGNKVF